MVGGNQSQQTQQVSSATAHIKTRSEKQEHLVQLLQMSLSEKISEKASAISEREREKEREEGGSESPSPSSTGSSGGEVAGEYVLYTEDDTHSSKDSGMYMYTCLSQVTVGVSS